MKKDILCTFCKSSITKKLPGIRKRKQYKNSFCSSLCWGNYQKQENDKKREEKFCVQCGNHIRLREKNGSLPKITNWGNRKYCTRSCANTGIALARAKGDEHFWSHVTIKEPDQCWPWRGGFFKALMKTGAYGRYNNVAYRTRRAHRIAYIKANGPIGHDVVIRHDCDNPACCNPGHLKRGTHQDNTDDMKKRQRFRPPARDLRPGTIVKQEILEAIWNDYVRLRKSNGGKRLPHGQYRVLEEKHSVTPKTIRQLINCAVTKLNKEERRKLFFL